MIYAGLGFLDVQSLEFGLYVWILYPFHFKGDIFEVERKA